MLGVAGTRNPVCDNFLGTGKELAPFGGRARAECVHCSAVTWHSSLPLNASLNHSWICHLFPSHGRRKGGEASVFCDILSVSLPASLPLSSEVSLSIASVASVASTPSWRP